MAKTAQELLNQNNVNKGITTGLDSSATKNPQPSGMFNSDKNRIDGADPKTPSTNPATRREQYNIDKGVPGSSDIPTYFTDPTMGYTPQRTTKPQEQTGPRTISSYYSDLGGKEAMDEINAIFNQKWISTASKEFQEVYGEAATTAINNALQSNIDLWKALTEYRWSLWHTSTNADFVRRLAESVYEAVAYNRKHWISNEINEIAKNTWATPEEVQAVLTGDAYRLVELTDEYKNREFREFYRKAEDLSLDMQYNRQTYQNTKNYTDYQFNSTMDKLQRSMFDAERTAKGTAAGLGMTGTQYTLNRIRAQYEQQINDVTNTYQYQSAQAQLNINYALENYKNALIRIDQDLDYYTQDAQKLALQEITNLNSAVGLSATQQKQILLQLQSDIDKIKSEGFQSVVKQLEAGNTTLAKQIAQAYGLDTDFLQIKQETLGWYEYTPVSEGKKTGGLSTYIDSIADKIEKHGKIRVGNCGEPVNDYLKALWLWTPITDTKSSKTNLKNSDTPTVWSIMILDGSTIWTELTKKHGHVAIVTGIDEANGTITVLESNASTGLQYKTYNMKDVYGYFDPSKWYNESATDFTDDELTAAKNIYDADMDMMNTVQRFKDAYSGIEDTLNMDINDIPGSIFWKVLKAELKLKWIETVGDLFYHATNAESSYYDEATNLLRQLNNSKLNQAAKLLRQITNKTFIQQLITAKGQGATFWNLTEWEGRRIETAYNEISWALDYESMIEGVNFLLSNLANDLTYMNDLYWTNLKPRKKYGETEEENVTPPEGLTEEQKIELINQIINWGTGGNTTWVEFHDF